ncbi:DUF3021 domain-containing protein [Lactobacillaceae bacterium L1_55_11]|nr:DUF3021 domain-containing protein [Lactobacillaceae bacterium L1_55_11]
MKAVMKYLWHNALVGLCIGFSVAMFFSLINGAHYWMPSSPEFVDRFSSPLMAALVSMFLWMGMGLVFGASNYIFNIERWSIDRQSTVHFLVTYVGFSILAILAGWFKLNTVNFLVFSLIYVGYYLLGRTLHKRWARQNVDDLNQKLQQIRR